MFADCVLSAGGVAGFDGFDDFHMLIERGFRPAGDMGGNIVSDPHLAEKVVRYARQTRATRGMPDLAMKIDVEIPVSIDSLVLDGRLLGSQEISQLCTQLYS